MRSNSSGGAVAEWLTCSAIIQKPSPLCLFILSTGIVRTNTDKILADRRCPANISGMSCMDIVCVNGRFNMLCWSLYTIYHFWLICSEKAMPFLFTGPLCRVWKPWKIRNSNDRGNCLRSLSEGFLRSPDLREERSLFLFQAINLFKWRSPVNQYYLRVRTKINSQILSVEAPAWQGAKAQEYQAYSELSQRSQAGCIGA